MSSTKRLSTSQGMEEGIRRAKKTRHDSITSITLAEHDVLPDTGERAAQSSDKRDSSSTADTLTHTKCPPERITPSVSECVACSIEPPTATHANCVDTPTVCQRCHGLWIHSEFGHTLWTFARCPGISCNNRLGREDIKRFAYPADFIRYQETTEPSANQQKEAIRQDQAEFRAITKEEEHVATLRKIEATSVKCPGWNCDYHIEKIKGCDHIICTRCKAEFCYCCKADYLQIRFKGNSAHVAGCKLYTPDTIESLGGEGAKTGLDLDRLLEGARDELFTLQQ